jgi:hypothetical protein
LETVLARLGERIKPVVLAQERTMPVVEALAPLLPEGSLVRGRVISCAGDASMSIACAVVRDALVAGAWLAVIDVDTFGADAAAELGIPLERVVRIESGSGSEPTAGDRWIDVMGAALDGFDIVMTSVPGGLCGDRRPAAVKKLMSRLMQRGTVIVTIGTAGVLACDVELVSERTVWEGLGDGAGHLHRRRIDVVAGGRRLPGRRSCQLTMTGSAQRVEITGVPVSGAGVPEHAAARLAG